MVSFLCGMDVSSASTARRLRFGNNDYNIGVELEFSGLADDLFGVTTLKNKVSLKKEAWDALAQIGLTRGIQAARARRKELFADWNAEVAPTVSDGDGNNIRPLEIAASAENREPRKPVPADTAERIRQIGETNLEQEVERRSVKSGKPEVVVRQELVAEIHDRDFIVEFQPLRGSDFISLNRSVSRQSLWLIRIMPSTKTYLAQNTPQVSAKRP